MSRQPPPSSSLSSSLNKAIAEFDPLTTTNSPIGDEPAPAPTPAAASPGPSTPSANLSFKRRTPSRGSGIRTGLLGGLLKGDEEEDKVPQPAVLRPDAPKRIEIPSAHQYLGAGGRQRASSSALDSEFGEDEDGQEGGEDEGLLTPTSQAARRWPTRVRAPSGASKGTGAGRISFSQGGGRFRGISGKFDDATKGGLLSPGGRGEGGGAVSFVAPPTPLPTIPILVLCLAMFGEFLSASTSSPFLYFMIEDFGVGQGPGGGGEAAVGFWSGIVGSVFFLSQFLTSLLWVSVAEKHGRRAVLFASLLGNALSLVAFGTSKNLGTAICVRLTMGLFNGAVGVARSAVQNITDSSNESRAFTYMGLAWGLGGIVGSVIGGLTENPVRNHPYFFGDSELFTDYPYLLPCLISGSITFTGAILSLFLSADGGPREGGIKLPTEKDVGRAASTLYSLFTKLKALVLRRETPAIAIGTPPPEPVSMHRSDSQPVLPNREAADQDRGERMSVTSGMGKQNAYGSAFNGFNPLNSRRVSRGTSYGYDRPRRNTGRSVYRAMSVGTSTRYAPDYEDLEHAELNFAQRLLLANEPAVFSLSELWVANATRNDDAASQLDFDESVFEREEDEESRVGMDVDDEEYPDFEGFGTAPPSMEDLRGAAKRQDVERGRLGTGATPVRPSSPTMSSRPGSPSLRPPRPAGADALRSPSRERPGDRVFSYGRPTPFRRGSVASSMRGPAIFANTGLDPSSLGGGAVTYVPPPSPAPVKGSGGGGAETPNESAFNPMAAIPETRAPSIIEVPEPAEEEDEKESESLIRQLPLAMIAQYALVALHGTTCDQVFVSFIVTPVASGGLGLKAANYAFLVSIMFLFQSLWQFRFYPFVCAPRGPFSHLAMFRLGLALYVPVYVLFPELRGLLKENTNIPVMFGMILLSALRYLASTCAYTAVMVLINAMSPPHLVPLANGLAQSAVSLARFLGPLAGGTIWAASIADGPNTHAWPFNYAAGFIFVATICALGFIHSFRIR
ncbi:major facilitator superfamily protein [Pseudohyphozyma bogoriensis]|nr:major facilitator superfamily protein [Pseudohyphozyma bogoriensis]